MNREIERKYAIKYLPKDLKIESIVHIRQAFIYRDKLTLIRIRDIKKKYPNEEQTYVYTLKAKGDIEYNNNYDIAKKYELENQISEKDFKQLIQNKISNVIEKTRIVIPIENKLKVEFDIYYGYLTGLLTAEIEFPNEELAKKFKKPEWLGEELGYKELSNRKLSQMTREEFLSKVSEEMLENNAKVLNENEVLKKYKEL